MKKRVLLILCVIVISECIAITGIVLFLSHPSTDNSLYTLENNTSQVPAPYNIHADVELEGTLVRVREEITFTEPSMSLAVNIPSANAAATDILLVTGMNTSVSRTRSGNTLRVTCSAPEDRIRLEYTINIATSPSTLSYSNGMYRLTNFLATPGVYRNGQVIETYSSSFGDPYIYEVCNYYVSFRSAKTINILAPGKKEEHLYGAKKLTIFEIDHIRDFPAVAGENLQAEAKKYKGRDFYYVGSTETAAFVEEAFDYAEKQIGPYPYSQLFVIQAELPQRGMEFSNMIFVASSRFENHENLRKVTIHETLHQWFYGIIGTDQLNHPFLDEGLVNYLTFQLCGTQLDTCYDSKLFGMDLKDYSSREQYINLAYNDASVYFSDMHRSMGNNFYKLLQQVYAEKKFSILYYEDFIKYANALNFRGKIN